MKRELHVLLTVMATIGLFPASQPCSVYAHFLHTRMGTTEASPWGEAHTAGQKGHKEADMCSGRSGS